MPIQQGDGVPIQGEGQVATPNPTTEDGLADAYANFVQSFSALDFDANFPLGFAFHPGLSTEQVLGFDGRPLSGVVTLNMNSGDVSAFLNNADQNAVFDLWFVKNDPKGTVAPESKDQMLKVGSFVPNEFGFSSLNASLGANINFDLDLVVLTRPGKKPNQNVIAVGDRTLFEKRLMRFRQNKGMDPVSGTLAENIETTDPLVARGAQLFFNETFGGNGRTCGTCHRAENNLTIDPKFIKKLPQTDPLFVAENNPALAKLEDSVLLRTRGLITENLDGFDDPKKFVMRGVPHTLSLGLTNGIGFGNNVPSHRLGWSGDGGPGRSTLHEFTFGAIIQHFTKSMARRPGVDFRIPTEEELDALEAFQLFTGRQKAFLDFLNQFPLDPRASSGQQLFNNTGCTSCHQDTFGGNDLFNQNFDTGVANLTPDLPDDDGFLTPGDRSFNVPPLVEAADTGPFFHNNAVNTIEDAVGFYFSPTFQASPSSFFIFAQLETEQQRDIAAFLRVLNSAANIEQVKKRAEYVANVRSSGNTDLLKIAIADARDARVVLSDRELSADAQDQIRVAEDLLKSAKSDKDKNRPATMKQVVQFLDAAMKLLFTDVPPEPPGSGGAGGKGGSGGFPEGGEAGFDSSGGIAGTTGGRPGAGGSVSVGGGPSATGGTGTAGTSTDPAGGTSGTSGTGGRAAGGTSGK